MPKHSLQASVCVFSDRMMAHQHLEFVAGQRVCLFWPHDGVSAAVIHCIHRRPKFFQDNAWDCDIMLVDLCILYGYVLMFGSLDSCHDRAAASVIHCMLKHSLQASVCVFSDRMMAHQHLEFVAGQRVCFFFWPHDGVSAAVIHCTRSHCSIRNSQHAEEGFTPKSWDLQIPLTRKSFNPKLSVTLKSFNTKILYS